MGEQLYKVLCDGTVLAEKMTLSDAMIFVKAYFETYNCDVSIRITIQHMEYEEYRELETESLR